MLSAEELTTKRFVNRKFLKEDFSKQQLQHADFRGAQLIECNFDGAELRYANFENANCWGSSFVDAICYRTNFKDACLENTVFDPRDAFGMTITLTCHTFTHMKTSRLFMMLWLFLLTLMELPKDVETQVITIIGPDRWRRYKEVFDRRIL